MKCIIFGVSFISRNPAIDGRNFLFFDERRTRLYRIVIGRELGAIEKKFLVFGGIGDDYVEAFQPDIKYDRFFVLLKSEMQYGSIRE